VLPSAPTAAIPIRDGAVAGQAEPARLGYVSLARLSQVMTLLQLALKVRESLLFLPPTYHGGDPVTKRDLHEPANAKMQLLLNQFVVLMIASLPLY